MVLIMKKVLIKMIRIYQKIPLKCHSNCRFYPTCSNYAIEAIDTYGSCKGVYLSIKRILKCNPLSKNIYDPVPMKEDKI